MSAVKHKTTTLVEMDGKQVPLNETCWLHFAPCGCLSGVAMGHAYGVDEDKVALAMTSTETKAEAKRDAALGFRFELITMTTYREKWAESFKVGCIHEPKWGVEPDPIPDGYAWARDGWNAKYRHLVEAERVADTSFEDGAQRENAKVTEGPALCGAGKRYAMYDNANGHLTHSTMTCSKCVKTGKQLMLAATA